MHIQHWNIDTVLEREARENYRTAFALSLKDRSAQDIIRELTFDGVAPHITVRDLQYLLRWIEQNLLSIPFSGVGVEVGAGPLVFSSVLARFTAVQAMYGIELCEPIIRELFPSVAHDIAGSSSGKLTGVVGDFDHMGLPDESVDFVFDFFSLHHSPDINVTFREIFRVLKPGGFVLMLDKARPDHYSDAQLDALLDAEYNKEYHEQFGLSPSLRLTRRANGEHEYRLRDWQRAAYRAGCSRFDWWRLEKPMTGGAYGLLKRLLSFLHVSRQLTITSALPKPRAHGFALDASQRVFTSAVNHFRKEMSVMIAYKS